MIVLKPLIFWLVKFCFKRGIAGRKVAWLLLAAFGAILRHFLESDRTKVTQLSVKPGERYSVVVDRPELAQKRRPKK